MGACLAFDVRVGICGWEAIINPKPIASNSGTWSISSNVIQNNPRSGGRMLTFDEWWNDQPVAQLPDTERIGYLRDLAQQVWASAVRAERMEQSSVSRRVIIMCGVPSTLTWGELLIRAGDVFIDNTTEEIGHHSFDYLCRAINLEEADRKHGTRPNYRIEDVWMDDDWKS